MAQPISTALLSYGMSGKVFHAPLLAANSNYLFAKVWERKSENSKQKFPHVEIVRDLETILKDPEIELVVINTPNPTHFDFTKKALMAGKHVVVEKPFTNTVQEAEELISIAKNVNKTLTVFQNRRWDGDFKTVQQVVNSQLVGELVEYEAHYDRFRNYIEENTWKEEDGPGSGILYNLGSHMIDQVLVLFGMPKAVTADIRIQRPGGKVSDNYEIILEYGGLKATIKSSYLVREEGPRYILHGTKGSFIKYGIDPQEQALKDGVLPGTSGWGIEQKETWGRLNTDINGLHYHGNIETLPGSYQDFYNNLFSVIRESKDLAVRAEEAKNVIKVIEAAVESNRLKLSIKL